MEWTGWLILVVSLLGIYLIGLIGYRLLISTKKLRQEVARADQLISELKNVEHLAVEFSRPSKGAELEELLINRELLKRARRHRAEARKRKLIERISSIEVDKR